MIIHNIEQQSDAWFAIRKGKMTASHADAIANARTGLNTYIYKILAEQYSSGEVDFYSNKHIERGNDLESIARAMYELENNVVVNQVGFIEHNEYVGCSPDGLVGEDGGIEIKCHDDIAHFRMLVDGELDSKYIWQIQMNLLITDRKWFDYVAFNPNYKQSLIIIRVFPNEAKHQKLLKGFEIGENLIKFIKEKISSPKL